MQTTTRGSTQEQQPGVAPREDGARLEYLRGLADRHALRYETQSGRMRIGAQDRAVCELDICAPPNAASGRFCAGCENCQAMYTAEREIAEWALGGLDGDFMSEILPFDNSLHFSSSRERVDVVLAIIIMTKNPRNYDSDRARLDLCLSALRSRLAELGLGKR